MEDKFKSVYIYIYREGNGRAVIGVYPFYRWKISLNQYICISTEKEMVGVPVGQLQGVYPFYRWKISLNQYISISTVKEMVGVPVGQL